MNTSSQLQVEILSTFEPGSSQGSRLDLVAAFSQGCVWADPEFDHQLFADKCQALKQLIQYGYLDRSCRLTQSGEKFLRIGDN